MIDALVKFADLATAQADPVVQQHMDALHTLFRADYVLADVKVWRASQDVGNVHTFLTGWFVLISLPSLTPAAIALRDHAALQVCIDADKAKLRQAGMVLKSNVGGILQDVRMGPIFAGRDYPFGALA
jgi:hypothetical protein